MKVGDIIDGKYELVRLIGQGGMGSVWEGRHVQIGRRAALKFLHPQVAHNAEIASRFLREAQAAAAIGSDHIVDIYDVGQLPNGAPYLVMEYLDGEDLASVLKREGRLEPARAVEVILQLCEALEPAHERGIVHRDLKPANLILVHHSKLGQWLKVLDFGIAKVQAELSGQSRSLTKTGSTMGTPFYMAPEQFQRAKHVEHWADIYSAGVILYQLLSGRLPFEADTYEELIVAVVTEEPVPLREARPGIDVGLESVVMRSISRDAKARFGGMKELAEALQPFASQEAEPVREASHAIPPTKHVEPAQPAAPAIPRTEYVEAEIPRLPPTQVHAEPPPAGGLPWKPTLIGGLAVLVVLGGVVAWWPRGNKGWGERQRTPEERAPVPQIEVPASLPGPTPPVESPASASNVRPGAPGEWVLIRAGSFTMGSFTGEPDRENDEAQHRVTLTHDFEMQTTEVTQGQFQDVMGYTPSEFTGCGRDCPVEQVSWHEAAAYCNVLSERAGLGQCYGCNGSGGDVTCSPSSRYSTPYSCPGYRLPTEAEWEYGARAGTTGSRYGDLNAIAWHSNNSGSTTHRVGQKRANAWGLYDMLGNVWEWCHDWYGDYPGGAVTDPFGPGEGSFRVYRGGSWNRYTRGVRAALRNRIVPGDRNYYLGFRLSRSSP